MDLFIVILIALFPCWLIVYFSSKLTLETKYKIAVINFLCSLIIISGIYITAYGIWKIPIIYSFLIPNILAGSIIPLILLIGYTLFMQVRNKENS